MPSEPIRLVVGGVEYPQWYEFDIDSDIFVPADSFSVMARLPPSSVRNAFREGSNVDVYIGDDRQMAGVVDDVRTQSTKSKGTISLVGRDKGAWLLDSDADHIKGKSWSIKTLAEKLIKPAFGIRSVIYTNEPNRSVLLGRKSKKKSSTPNPFSAKPRNSIKVDPGQKIARLLDRETKKLGITWWLTAQGDLYFGKPNYNQSPSYTFERGYNILEAVVERSTKDRCSELIVLGQGPGSSGQAFAAQKNVKFKGVAKDPDLVKRGIVRREIITDSDVESNAQAQAAADWEMGRRRLNAIKITVTVPGFRQDTRLYAVDTIATVKIPHEDIDGEYYVTGRRFTESKAKSRTTLTLHEKGVFLPMRQAIAAVAHLVTDLVFGDDGVVTGTGWDDDDELEMQPAWQFGFQSRPLDGTGGLALRVGGNGGLALVLGYRNTQYEIALEKGETALHNAIAGCRLLLDKDGNALLDAAVGKYVKLGGGAQFVALANLVNSELDAIKSYVDSHQHLFGSIACTTGVISGTSGAPVTPMTSPSPVAAENVKAT